MKRFVLAVVVMSFMSGCFIFQKKEKYGCPTNGRNVGAEQLASGDEKAIKAASKSKYRSKKKF